MKVRELIQELLKHDIDKELKIVESTENQWIDIDYIAFNRVQDVLMINSTKEA